MSEARTTMSARERRDGSIGLRARGLGVCAIASSALHAVALALVLGGAGGGDDGVMETSDAPPLVRQPEELTLGDPDMEVLSLAWIGSREATGADGPVGAMDQAERRTPMREQAAAVAASARRAAGRAASLASAVRGTADRLRAGVRSVAEAFDPSAAPDRPPRASEQRAGREATAPGEADDDMETDSVNGAIARERTGERSPTPDEREASPAESAEGDGGDDEREAPAVRMVTVDERELGEPLEGFGLRIITRRPRFSIYTELRARIGNPRAVVDFGTNGLVRRVEWVKRSGNTDVDAAVLNALYTWKAIPQPEQYDPNSEQFDGEQGASGLPARIEFTIRLIR